MMTVISVMFISSQPHWQQVVITSHIPFVQTTAKWFPVVFSPSAFPWTFTNLTCICRLGLRTGLKPSKLRPVCIFTCSSEQEQACLQRAFGNTSLCNLGRKAKGKTKSLVITCWKAISVKLFHTSFERVTRRIPRCSLVTLFFLRPPFFRLSVSEAMLI